MAWNWAASADTTIIGLAGIIATYLSGRRQVTSARQVAEDQARASLHAQREERQQKRIEVAYPKLLDVVVIGDHWLSDVSRFALGDPGQVEPPVMPALLFGLLEQGSLTATLSPRTAQLVDGWAANLRHIDLVAAMIRHYRYDTDQVLGTEERAAAAAMVRKAVGKPDATADDLGPHFVEYYIEAKVASLRIRSQVWRELRGEDDGYVREAE